MILMREMKMKMMKTKKMRKKRKKKEIIQFRKELRINNERSSGIGLSYRVRLLWLRNLFSRYEVNINYLTIKLYIFNQFYKIII
jgi:hypothetical protein